MLDARPVGPGFTLVYDKTVCLPLFGFLSETVAWLPGIAGSIRFVNAAKRTVSEFTEGVGGRYEALRESDGVYFLSNLQFVDPGDSPQFTDLLGEWNMARPDGPPICTVSLTNESTGEDTFVVTVKPGCDQSITRFAGCVGARPRRRPSVFRQGRSASLRPPAGRRLGQGARHAAPVVDGAAVRHPFRE
jgi:hypothetical protein